MLNVAKFIEENKKRRAKFDNPYNPLTGEGSPIERQYVSIDGIGEMYLPTSMLNVDWVNNLAEIGNIYDLTNNQVTENDISLFFIKERIKHDFEFWAATGAKIQDKITKGLIPFILRPAQLKLLAELERLRLLGLPIKIVLLKARQWGGSTLVQLYMAWISICLKENWHSAICADVENQARNIRGMFTRLAKNYPQQFGSITLAPYEGSTKNRIVVERGNIIGIGSAQKPDSLRSFDFSMLHLSEVGLWKRTQNNSPEDLAQSLRATVPDVPCALIVLESTAKGVGNFFHNEWQNAASGKSNYSPVFVPWFEIETYQRDITDYPEFIQSMTADDIYRWELGATLEGINWYKYTKKGENYDDWRMGSEYPTTPEEAFQSSGQRVFSPIYTRTMLKDCRDPEFIGEIYGESKKGPQALKNISIAKEPTGFLKIWQYPDTSIEVSNRYCAFADIGGRSKKADFSVIRIVDRYWMMEGGDPEIVAEWHGHLDQDLFAWKCAQLCMYYNKALLAIETNSLKTQESEGDHFLTVLDEIAKYYPNLYIRNDMERIDEAFIPKYGFQTNVKTKTMIIDCYNSAMRERYNQDQDETEQDSFAIVERNKEAVYEADFYENKPDGSMGAIEGKHDDYVMTTAGVTWLATSYMPMPKLVIHKDKIRRKVIRNEASF